MSKYDEDLKEAFEILKSTKLDELLQIAVEAMDNAAADIEMETNQEWHAKITLESALMVIAEKLSNQNRLTIPNEIVDLLDKELDGCEDKLYIFNERYINMNMPDKLLLYKNYNIISIYLASKSLGIELVEMVE